MRAHGLYHFPTLKHLRVLDTMSEHGRPSWSYRAFREKGIFEVLLGLFGGIGAFLELIGSFWGTLGIILGLYSGFPRSSGAPLAAILEAIDQKSPQIRLLGRSWVVFGPLLRALGPYWEPLGPLLVLLGSSWAHLEALGQKAKSMTFLRFVKDFGFSGRSREISKSTGICLVALLGPVEGMLLAILSHVGLC